MTKASSLIPLILLFVVIGVAIFIGVAIYQWSTELADRGKQKLERKHMSFTKDGGLRVAVREKSSEDAVDGAQGALVNAWNNAELPNYKSRLGWNSTQQGHKKTETTMS